jgi:phosphoglycerate dehydrogenase-like enzyme
MTAPFTTPLKPPVAPLTIAFHGQNAANFRQNFDALIDPAHRIINLSDALDGPGEALAFATADVIVGVKLNASMPLPQAVRLYHAPSAGTDAIDVSRLPATAQLCNCHGHENAIAEYVMAALLQRHVPLAQADADLRRNQWTYYAGRPTALRTELGQQTIGLVGFGHIAQTVALRAKAFGMRVHVANRSAIPTSAAVDASFGLGDLPAFMATVDAVIVSLPLTPETTGLVNRAALHAMRPSAVVVNVGRGPVIDEEALYEVLATRRIAGAVIDTWYQYPAPGQDDCAPSRLDFAGLDNVVMTPHMSGWTSGTVERRQQTIADNIGRMCRGEDLVNTLRVITA